MENKLLSILLIVFFAKAIPIFCDPDPSVEITTYEGQDKNQKRIFQDVSFYRNDFGMAHFSVSLPEIIPEEGLPVMIVVAGRLTGKNSLKYIPYHDNFAIVAYEYPKDLKMINHISQFFTIFKIRQAILNIPDQLLAIAKWCQEQTWASKKFAPSVIGFSFGCIFVPPTYHLPEQNKMPLGPGVMGYCGAGLYCLLYNNLPQSYRPRWALAHFLSWIFSPLEPSKHLPYITNTHFLLLNSTNDEQIPFRCAEKLQKMTPEPKTIINLDTEHLHPGNPELIQRLAEISRSWIEKQIQEGSQGQ